MGDQAQLRGLAGLQGGLGFALGCSSPPAAPPGTEGDLQSQALSAIHSGFGSSGGHCCQGLSGCQDGIFLAWLS